jgi:hypothetical protein
MSKSIIVTKDGKKFKVLVCFVQRGISFNQATLANKEAIRIGSEERIDNVILMEEE